MFRLLDAHGGIVALRTAVRLLEDPDVKLRLWAAQSVQRWHPSPDARRGDAEVGELLDRSRHLFSDFVLRRAQVGSWGGELRWGHHAEQYVRWDAAATVRSGRGKSPCGSMAPSPTWLHPPPGVVSSVQNQHRPIGRIRLSRACTGLDVTGADHDKASSWLKQAKKETDSLYEKQVAGTGNKKVYVDSGEARLPRASRGGRRPSPCSPGLRPPRSRLP
ncbi:hypothetical protein GCM10010330_57810 [Streptomyces tendae]|nr:hypothetical protein GCM10010330_57810 [Streptomyces tendae]